MATEVHSDISRQFLGASLKMEVRFFTGVLNDETFVSKLATPLGAFGFSTADAGGTSTNFSVTISDKTLTFRDPPTTSVGVVVIGR